MKISQEFIRNNRWRIVAFVASSIIILINLFRLHNIIAFNSDGVYVQNFVFALQNHTHNIAIFPNDSYLLKTPFYWLINHSGLSPVTGLSVTLAAFTFFTYFGFYIAVALLNKIFKWFDEKYFVLAFIYFVSLAVTYNYMMIANTRNIELALTFLLFVPLAIGFKKGLSWTYKIGTSLVLSLLLFEDPYFLYAVYLPLLVLVVLSSLLVKKKAGHWLIAKIIIASVVLARIWGFIASKFGIYILVVPLKLVALSKLVMNVKTAFTALLLLGSIPGIFKLYPAAKASYLNYFIITSVMTYSLIFFCYSLKNFKNDPWKTFMLSIPWLITIVYIVQPDISADNYRYMLFAVLGFAIILAFLLNSLARQKKLLMLAELLILVSTLLNVRHSTEALAVNLHPNAINYQIVQDTKSLGLVKGYTDYWSASINTYFSGGKISFLPVTCTNNRLEPMYWAIDTGGFTKVKSTRTFYLYDNLGFYTRGCSIENLTKVYGNPVAIKALNTQYTIAIYDYDIGSKMTLTFP